MNQNGGIHKGGFAVLCHGSSVNIRFLPLNIVMYIV